MNLRQLECFREILVAGTVTGAARALGISQPSASNHIANLERELGFPLFKRSNGRLIATPEANDLSADVERTLESVELTAHRARRIRDKKFGNLVVAAYPDIAINFLPWMISRFRAERSAVRVTIMARRAEMMRRLLPTQLYDLAIVEWPIDHPSVQVEEFELRCVCALPESHPLIERPVIGPRDLDGLPFVSLLPEHTIHSQLESAFAEADAVWNVAIETQTMESVSAFIRQRAGVGLLDPFSARHGENNGIVVRRFEPAIIYRIAMLLPRDRMRSSILEEFIETVKSEFDTVGNPARRRQGRKSARSTSA